MSFDMHPLYAITALPFQLNGNGVQMRLPSFFAPTTSWSGRVAFDRGTHRGPRHPHMDSRIAGFPQRSWFGEIDHGLAAPITATPDLTDHSVSSLHARQAG